MREQDKTFARKNCRHTGRAHLNKTIASDKAFSDPLMPHPTYITLRRRPFTGIGDAFIFSLHYFFTCILRSPLIYSIKNTCLLHRTANEHLRYSWQIKISQISQEQQNYKSQIRIDFWILNSTLGLSKVFAIVGECYMHSHSHCKLHLKRRWNSSFAFVETTKWAFSSKLFLVKK